MHVLHAFRLRWQHLLCTWRWMRRTSWTLRRHLCLCRSSTFSGFLSTCCPRSSVAWCRWGPYFYYHPASPSPLPWPCSSTLMFALRSRPTCHWSVSSISWVTMSWIQTLWIKRTRPQVRVDTATAPQSVFAFSRISRLLWSCHCRNLSRAQSSLHSLWHTLLFLCVRALVQSHCLTCALSLYVENV